MSESLPPPFEDALAGNDPDRVEELWLEQLERPKIPVDTLLEVRRRLFAEGHKQLARTLLELLAETLEGRRDHSGTLAALRELVRLVDKPPHELLERLERSAAATRADSPSLKPVLTAHRITEARRPLSELETVETWLDHDVGTVVEVVGQGVGRVVDVNLELGHVKVDIGGRKPVTVGFGAFAKYLRRLPEGDFRRHKVEQPEVLATLTHDQPGEALVQLLTSLGEPTDVATIRTAFDGLVAADGWSSWWAKARKHPRIVTSGSGSRLRYGVTRSADSAVETMLSELADAEPSQRLQVARRLVAKGEQAAEATARFLADSLQQLERRDPGLAWETASLLIDLPGGRTPGEAARERILTGTAPMRLLAGVGDRAARLAALEAIRAADPDGWPEVWGDWMLHEEHPVVLSTLAAALEAEGHDDIADGALEAVFRAHTDHPAPFIWACEAMTERGAPEAARRRMTPSVLEKLPDTLTRSEFASLRARAKALLDGGKVAIRLILEQATPQQASRFAGRINRLDVVEPDRQRLVERAVQQCGSVTAREPDEPLLVATQQAVDAKQAELRQLLEVDIPKTLKGINAAAAEGDLRENFEYHMLRDRQELQSARAAKLQRELAQVRILEPGAADCSRVNIGTVVHFANDTPPALTILGAWDADPKQRRFANGTELAQLLLGHGVGDEVEVEGQPAVIARIEPWSP